MDYFPILLNLNIEKFIVDFKLSTRLKYKYEILYNS